MTTNLKPVTLDIVITKITPKTVKYELFANGEEEKWCIPAGSTFDTSKLVVGQRYRVTSHTITAKVWDYKARKFLNKERFEWTSAVEIGQKVKLQARSSKQRQASEDLAAKPLVDNGSLFKW